MYTEGEMMHVGNVVCRLGGVGKEVRICLLLWGTPKCEWIFRQKF